MPPANSLKLNSDSKILKEYKLLLQYCPECHNLQLSECVNNEELYKDYLYVTPDSKMLQRHYQVLIDFLSDRKYLNNRSSLIEVGSNSGQFLQQIKKYVDRYIGIDPAESIVKEANEKGINTICDFFGTNSVEKILKAFGRADLIVGRHCMAHNCDLNSLFSAACSLLTDDGVLVIENAYVLNTIENNEYDQIYHEHMYYFSIRSLDVALRNNGLRIIDVTKSDIHGGSIVFVVSKIESNMKESDSVKKLRRIEELIITKDRLSHFAQNSRLNANEIYNLVAQIKKDGGKIYCYGATAKGSTLLNYSRLTNKHIDVCVDNTPIKQNRVLAGSNIPIVDEDYAIKNPPDYFLLTAWNYKEEIVKKYRDIGNLKTLFIVPVPTITIL